MSFRTPSTWRSQSPSPPSNRAIRTYMALLSSLTPRAYNRGAANGPRTTKGPGDPGPAVSSGRELVAEAMLDVRLDVVALVARRRVGLVTVLPLVRLDVVLLDLVFALFRHCDSPSPTFARWTRNVDH